MKALKLVLISAGLGALLLATGCSNKTVKEMEGFAQNRKYEQAAKVRDQIRAIGALYAGTKDVNYYKETEQLQRMLGLPLRPERIEAFDISNILPSLSLDMIVMLVKYIL